MANHTKLLAMLAMASVALSTGCLAVETTAPTTETTIETTTNAPPEGALQLEFDCMTKLYLSVPNTVKIYTFAPPNDYYEVVVLNGNYPHVVASGQESIRPCFGHPTPGIESFYGITENYLLELEPDGTITAIAYEWADVCEVGESPVVRVPFEELPEDEKLTAVYPNGYYYCSFPEPK